MDDKTIITKVTEVMNIATTNPVLHVWDLILMTIKGGKQKRCENNIKEWTGTDFATSVERDSCSHLRCPNNLATRPALGIRPETKTM